MQEINVKFNFFYVKQKKIFYKYEMAIDLYLNSFIGSIG